MYLTKIIKQQILIQYVDVILPVKYDDEDMPFDAPLRKGDMWEARIDLFDHRIVRWPKGQTLSFDMKVCDGGIYILRDPERNEITRHEDYVPHSLIPGQYGDYVALDIDENGVILNWKANANLDDFAMTREC